MISINVEKAKLIAHDIRRKAREKEFAPYDAVIAKQIPGGQTEAAETARQAIREKYAAMQTQIEDASTPEEIKAALPI